MIEPSELKFGKQVNDFYPEEKWFRQSVFEGAIYILEPNASSLSLCDDIDSLIASKVPIQPDEPFCLDKIHQYHSFETIFTCLNHVKRKIATQLFTQNCLAKILPCFGLTVTPFLYDAMRLRWNQPLNDFDPWASYSVMHRDTWYANPQSQLNFWIPLTDTLLGQGFKIFSEFFNSPIDNTSQTFNFSEWRNQGGFQSSRMDQQQFYPTVKTLPDSKNAINIDCAKGSMVIFSAAHLHQTSHNQSDQSRLSVDFRVVYPEDNHNKLGASNTDNASKGDASVDYYLYDPA